MATPNESSALTDLQGIKDGELDDNSDVESKVGIPCKTTGRGRHPIHSRGAVDALTALQTTTGMGSAIITNSLGKEQEQVLQQRERTRRRSQIVSTLEIHTNYMLTPLSLKEHLQQTTGQSLESWTIGPAATTPDELEARRILRERYLVPSILTQGQY